ncbi:unnamed protein product [Urochloa decumbens]|uniref:BTB domain-containing protein n=1 Tax=Urochloa decumbens TaxID=240449 RepID=A0ABC8WD10_9POAL
MLSPTAHAGSNTMKHTCTLLTEAARSVHELKIDGFGSVAATMMKCRDLNEIFEESNICVSSRCLVQGYQWEIRFYPARLHYSFSSWVALQLVFLSEADANGITAILSCQLVDPSGIHGPSEEKVGASKTFQHVSDCSEMVFVMKTREVEASGYVMSDSLTVQCTITVFKDIKAIPLPVCDLPQHLGELLQSKAGADVTFLVSGKSFAAHKSILAARSPVLMAEFFGEMNESTQPTVEIQDMDPVVFLAMLQFVYTGRVPELDEKEVAATTLAQRLIVAADRYLMDRLKMMCERRLAFGINVNTVATTLALAEQHSCSQLKAKCIKFITGGSPENLKAVLATEGYKHLENCSPSVVTELLMASHARKY